MLRTLGAAKAACFPIVWNILLWRRMVIWNLQRFGIVNDLGLFYQPLASATSEYQQLLMISKYGIFIRDDHTPPLDMNSLYVRAIASRKI